MRPGAYTTCDNTQVSAEKVSMLPPWRSTLTERGDHSDRSKMLANIAARPGRIAAIAPRLCESMMTITTPAKTIVSMIGRAIGRPFAASGAPKKIKHS